MIPYIVTLIFLIVIILYQVYATSESFTDSTLPSCPQGYSVTKDRNCARESQAVNGVCPTGTFFEQGKCYEDIEPICPPGTTLQANECVSTSSKGSTDASGNQFVTTDASGAEVKLSLSDLFGLLGPFNLKTKVSEKEKTESTPAPAETQVTAKSTAEIEERIAKSVAKQLKDELISQRTTDEVYDKYAPCDLTDSQAQGQEFENAKPSPQPDMSEYIRKDSIPCWNCSIP